MSDQRTADEMLLRYSKALETIAHADFDMKTGEANSLMRRIARDALNGRETFDKSGRLISTKLVKADRRIGMPNE